MTSCPVCDAQWGFDEFQFEQCFCCGYPDNADDLDWVDEEEEPTPTKRGHLGACMNELCPQCGPNIP